MKTKSILTSTILVAVGYYYLPVMEGGTLQCILLTGGLILSGVIVYLLLHFLMRTYFIIEAFSLFRKFLFSC